VVSQWITNLHTWSLTAFPFVGSSLIPSPEVAKARYYKGSSSEDPPSQWVTIHILWYGAMSDLEWFDPQQVTTRDGTLDSNSTAQPEFTPGTCRFNLFTIDVRIIALCFRIDGAITS
jgi:hypothetical protein